MVNMQRNVECRLPEEDVILKDSPPPSYAPDRCQIKGDDPQPVYQNREPHKSVQIYQGH